MSHPLLPQARRWLSPTSRLTPLPCFKARGWKFTQKANNLKLLRLVVCYLLHLFLLSFDYFSPTKNNFPLTIFLPPLSHQIIAKSTQFIYHREVCSSARPTVEKISFRCLFFFASLFDIKAAK